MNNRTIKTYDDLEREEQRLTAHLATLKLTLQEDISGVKHGLKEKLNPVKKIKAKVRELFVRDDKNSPAINFALNFGLDYILRLFIPNRTSVWTKTVIPFLTKNYVSHLITDEQRQKVGKYVNDAIGKLDQMIRKPMNKKQERAYEAAATVVKPAFTANTTTTDQPDPKVEPM
jgi:hypothetical protein